MPPSRFTHAELVDKALSAVKEAAEQRLREEAVPKSRALRFAFAFLASGHADHNVFDMLWKAVTATLSPGETLSDSFGRRQTINCCCAFVHRLHGREPPER